MNIYVILYTFSIIFSVFYGIIYFKKYKNSSGLFFLIFTILSSIWFLGYFLFFSGITNENILLFLSRLDYGLSIGVLYSFLYFIKNFSSSKGLILSKKIIVLSCMYIIFLLLYINTDLIVKGLTYDKISNAYREVFGIAYLFHLTLSIIFIPLFLYYSTKRYKTLSLLNKVRLKNIIISVCIATMFIMIFQLILPLFGIWLFEKEVVYVFLLFILSVIYTVKRYFFSDLGYGVGKIIIGIVSVIFATIMLYLLEDIDSKLITGYWGINNDNGITNIVIGIIFFEIFYKILSKTFLGNTQKVELETSIQKLKQNISYIYNLEDLNNYLKSEIQKIFKTNFCEIIIFNENLEKNEIQTYFDKNLNQKLFINDIVFIEEKKNKFNKDKILEVIPKNSFLIFPIFCNEQNNIGIFTLGTKAFGDFYNINEINAIKNFVFFLEYHLKYIKNYEQIKDLSVNLDKKIDEKTIEYNNLINKQKEFISVISHEIKSPISSAVFQADSIIDDLESGDFTNTKLKNELEILNSLLIKTGELTSKLFSVQYYDTNLIELYKEKIQISTLLETELDVYSHVNENIKFVNKIDKNMGFIEIDKIQFRQVIENIITNSIKFVGNLNGIISLTAYIKSDFLYVIIEDNGIGFKGIEVSKLFEKYSTGSGNYMGLGMGLYLCKKIIDMHNGEIEAGISDEFSGAKFSIKIPIN